MERINKIANHLSFFAHQKKFQISECAAPRPQNRPDDIVVISAKRTPIGKAKRGSFKNTHVEDLLIPVYKAVIEETGVNPEDIGDVCIGNVNQPGAGAARVRIAHFLAGLPESVPCMAVNRQCSSGLQAFVNAAGQIKLGACKLAMAGGVESMSMNSMGSGFSAADMNPSMGECEKAMDCVIPMGITSENVAERYGISREMQDRMSVESHRKAHEATAAGKFEAEIVPVTTSVVDKEGNEHTVTVTKDEGIRLGTMESLGRLKPVFKEGGSTTAGNSSQVSDGAAAVLLCRRDEAERRCLPILGVFRGFSVNGVPPDVMGIGPAVAIPKALENAGLSLTDIDVFEINEAFASQATYCVNKLGIPMEKVNPNGGAIALGHPLGCTGARMIGTLLHELKRRNKRGYGIVSMCIGTGMGAAAVFEHPGPQ